MNYSITIIRRLVLFFIVTLFLSGLTALPLIQELEFASRFFPLGSRVGEWLDTVYLALVKANAEYSFLLYGYDWLAFAHFMFAILFIGPLKDQVKNKWIIEFGIIACILIIPFAIVAGGIRSVPFWWRLIDCSFGVLGLFPLFICLHHIRKLEFLNQQTYAYEKAV
jgi:hypothetical protein